MSEAAFTPEGGPLTLTVLVVGPAAPTGRGSCLDPLSQARHAVEEQVEQRRVALGDAVAHDRERAAPYLQVGVPTTAQCDTKTGIQRSFDWTARTIFGAEEHKPAVLPKAAAAKEALEQGHR